MNRAVLSASNISAAALCPGKPRMETGLRDEETEYSKRGTMLHPFFMTSLDRSGLTPEDRELLTEADTLGAKFLAQFTAASEIREGEACEEEHEVELIGPVPGHPDVVYAWRQGDIVAVLDLKSGMGDVEHASDNYQLASYAALIWERKPFKICGVAIVQPDALGPRLTSATYSASQMWDVLSEIDRIKRATLEPDAPLVPGEKQCHFCKAKVKCEAFTGTQQLVLTLGTLAMEELPNDKLEALKVAISFSDKIKDPVNDELRKRINAGSMPGWELRNTGSVRSVTDSIGFYKRLSDILTAKEFDDCRTMTWGKLEELLKTKTGLSSKKVEALIDERSEGFVASTPKARSPVKSKKA